MKEPIKQGGELRNLKRPRYKIDYLKLKKEFTHVSYERLNGLDWQLSIAPVITCSHCENPASYVAANVFMMAPDGFAMTV